MKTEMKFTHVGCIRDIRKITKTSGASIDSSYMMQFIFDDEKIDDVFYLPASIFENAVEKYLLTKNFTRTDITSLRFQVLITNSFYWKYNPSSKKYTKVPGFYNTNYLNFISVYAGTALDQQHISVEIENQEEISL
jgi:hypothetical protein